MPSSSSSSSSPSSPLSNIQLFLTTKLDQNNYLLWKSQLLPIFRGHGLIGYINGTTPCPPKTSAEPASTGKLVPNLAYTDWEKQDQLLLSCLIASVTESVRSKIMGLNTSKDVWTALEKHFSSRSRARFLQLRLQLQTIKKGTLSITEYLQKVKVIIDHLDAGHTVPMKKSLSIPWAG